MSEPINFQGRATGGYVLDSFLLSFWLYPLIILLNKRGSWKLVAFGYAAVLGMFLFISISENIR